LKIFEFAIAGSSGSLWESKSLTPTDGLSDLNDRKLIGLMQQLRKVGAIHELPLRENRAFKAFCVSPN